LNIKKSAKKINFPNAVIKPIMMSDIQILFNNISKLFWLN
jgi:hypothetical protein